jgi:hypothetical protein
MCSLPNLIKLFCTALIPFTQGATMYLSSISLVTLLALFPDQIAIGLRLALISAVVFSWVMVILLSIISIKSEKTLIPLSVFSMILAIFDCVIPMVYSTIEAKIYAIVVSSAIILLNVFFLKNARYNLHK